MRVMNDCTFAFAHPDDTVGFRIVPNPARKLSARGLETLYGRILQLRSEATHVNYRRSGITPCPEDESILNFVYVYYTCFQFKVNNFALERCQNARFNVLSF